jgi:hypothetical protein
MGGVPFNPLTALTGLIIWADASVTASLTLSGSNITSIADQSGAGNNLAAGGGNVPYSATGFNTNKPAMVFTNGNTATLQKVITMGTGSTLTAWYVGTTGVGASSIAGRIISYGGGFGGDNNNIGSFTVAAGSPFTSLDLNRNGVHAGSSGLSVDPAGHRVIVTINSSGNMTMFVDGVAGGTTGTSNGAWANTGNFSLGRQASAASDYWYGPIGEFGLATGFSNSTLVGQLDTYLKNKWGL